MKQFLILAIVLLTTACAGFKLPSSYDSNESEGIIDILQDVRNLDCSEEGRSESIKELQESVQWMRLYTITKGSEDVYLSLGIIEQTVNGLAVRENMSTSYCNLKKKTLEVQALDTSEAVMKRFGK